VTTKTPQPTAQGDGDGINEKESKHMEIKFNIEKSERKTLMQKIAEMLKEDVHYLGAPTFAYEVAFFRMDKDGVLSFSDRSDTELVEQVLDGLADAGYESVEDESTDTGCGFPLNASISFPLAEHTVQSITNLICMIHSRGSLLSKATGGNFFADKSLADAILEDKTFRSVNELITYIREWNESNPPLTGISFDDDKLIFDGFGTAKDADYVQTFMKLAGAMNSMAITQKRVQAKDVDDSNEKYSLRVWLIRLGLNGKDCKADRNRLMTALSGNSAFRDEEARSRWEAKQKAKREATKAEQENNDAEEE